MFDFLGAVAVFNKIPFSKLSQNDFKLLSALLDCLLDLPKHPEIVGDYEKLQKVTLDLINIITSLEIKAAQLGFNLDTLKGLYEPPEKD